MKKLLLCFLLFLLIIPVYAEEYEVNTLIPVDQKATVHTEKFDYTDIIYNSQVDDRGNTHISFGNITNKTKSKTAISINILLFDENEKNVGFLTYCSDRDYNNENNMGTKVNGGQSIPFTIDVTNRYFGENKSIKDVFYIAVMDENKYCQIGGYSKFVGQTIEEIQGINTPEKENPAITFIEKVLKDKALVALILGVVLGLVIYCTICGVINSLHARMTGKKSFLCYIPVVNMYLGTKLAFGHIIAIIYILFYFASCVLFEMGIPFLLPIFTGIWILTFIVDVIKLITRNYDLFYFEPKMKPKYDEPTNKKREEHAIDLSYNNKSLDDTDHDTLDISAGENSNNNDLDSKEEKDESDLTKLFH